MAKKPRREQLSVFAAGSFSNIVLGFVMLGVFLLVMKPAIGLFLEDDGVHVVELIKIMK